ncbi:MAG: hypothetical protein AB8H86_14585 [Polyangiales bacterium]
MRGVFLALWLSAASLASAQDTPAPAVQIDEETGERYVEERPSEPIRQGALVAPPWAIYTAGGFVVEATFFLLARRLRSRS